MLLGLFSILVDNLQACTMGVTVVNDNQLVKMFINTIDIPFNKHLTDLNDLLQLVSSFSSFFLVSDL